MQEKKTDLPPQSIRVDICSQVITHQFSVIPSIGEESQPFNDEISRLRSG